MVDNKFLLSISRMKDEELLEFFVGEVETRANYIYQNDILSEDDWIKIDSRTDKIETMKAELLRRM